MDELEQILWIVTYGAATARGEHDPGMKADNAVLRMRTAETFFDDNFSVPPSEELDTANDKF